MLENSCPKDQERGDQMPEQPSPVTLDSVGGAALLSCNYCWANIPGQINQTLYCKLFSNILF